MSIVKSFSVGVGDMFYIDHNSDNFTIIDCYLSDDNKETIVNEIIRKKADKGITRFISTHPDEDHIQGLKYLDEKIDLLNFYCVNNTVIKEEETTDFKHYCKLRDDSKKAYYIRQGCQRRWMNLGSEERGQSGITIVWPDVDNEFFKEAMDVAEEEDGSANNISAVIKYSLANSAKILWFGDLEKDFMENIADDIIWPNAHIVFAPHHGRKSGKIPEDILEEINPSLVVIGEAPAENLDYYQNYNTITQNSAGDITFECLDKKVHVFVSEIDYTVDFLDDEDIESQKGHYYIGTLNL